MQFIKSLFNRLLAKPASSAPVLKVSPITGDKEWRQDGKLHRDDGPAVETLPGSKLWIRNGDLHREDGPAREWADGSKEWWRNGQRFMPEDTPALAVEQPVPTKASPGPRFNL